MKKLCLLAMILLPFMMAAQDAPAKDVFEDVVENEGLDYFSYIDSSGRQPVVTRKIPDSLVKRFQNDGAFWYANRSLPKKNFEKKPSLFLQIISQQWFRSLMWVIICLGFGAVLIWFLATSNIRLFRKPDLPIRHETGEVNTENIFTIDYTSEIQKALRQGAFRQAIRLHFLQVLSLLADRQLIRYQQDATNSDYLFQLAGTTCYKHFFMVTRHFEYTWYGQFEVTPAVYAAMEKDFQLIIKEVTV